MLYTKCAHWRSCCSGSFIAAVVTLPGRVKPCLGAVGVVNKGGLCQFCPATLAVGSSVFANLSSECKRSTWQLENTAMKGSLNYTAILLLSIILVVNLSTCVLASTTIWTYSDEHCDQIIESIHPPETGQCQTNTLGNCSSFVIASVDANCSSTSIPGHFYLM